MVHGCMRPAAVKKVANDSGGRMHAMAWHGTICGSLAACLPFTATTESKAVESGEFEADARNSGSLAGQQRCHLQWQLPGMDDMDGCRYGLPEERIESRGLPGWPTM